jgi:hypothetical protein
MADNSDEDTSADISTDGSSDMQTNPVTSNYKVLGQFTEHDGVGVLGQNDAGSGTPIGVKGVVPDSSTGYGLATPDDLRVLGDVDTANNLYVSVNGNRVLLIDNESAGDAGSIVLGHSSNSVSSTGAVVGGGGFDDGTTQESNVVGPNSAYATVGGGRNNRVNPSASSHSAAGTTIGGGRDNQVKATEGATIGGGTGNTVSSTNGVIAGGKGNTLGAKNAVIAGGVDNDVQAFGGTIGGGNANLVETGLYATIAGGHPADFGNASGTRNEAHATGVFIGAGSDNQAGAADGTRDGGRYATVPGGLSNTASGSYSFAAGRRAKAMNDGSFVWADSTDADVSDSGTDQFLVEASGGMGVGTTAPAEQLDVDGAVNASEGFRGNVGASAYLSTDQNIGAGAKEVIAFDTEKTDQRSEFDISTGEFTCAYDGVYHVDATINISGGSAESGHQFILGINVNGSTEFRNKSVVSSEAASTDPSYGISKTLYGLSSSETITLSVNNQTGSAFDVYGGDSSYTNMTIHQVA